MPRKTDTMAIKDPFLKKTAKLLPCQKEMIKYWINKGLSQRAVAKIFNCSRRSVIFIAYPERHKENLERRRERGGSKVYYDRAKHTKAIKEHRDYKKDLFN